MNEEINDSFAEYLKTARAEFDHYFGNALGGLWDNFKKIKEGKAPDFPYPKERANKQLGAFVDGMNIILEKLKDGTLEVGNRPEIDETTVNELIEIAGRISDATDVDQMKELFDKTIQIRANDPKE